MLLTYDFYDRAEASAVRAIVGDARRLAASCRWARLDAARSGDALGGQVI